MKKLILLDLDNTAFDGFRELGTLELPKKIKELQQKGWTIGINSDRCISSVIPAAKRLNALGPMILEKGNFCFQSLDALLKAEANHDYSPDFKNVADDFVSRLFSHNRQTQILLGNSEFYLKVLKGQLPKEQEIFILVNTHRKASLGFFVLEMNREGRFLSTKKSQTVLNKLTSLGIKSFDSILGQYPVYELNLERGYCIMHTPKTNKSLGVQKLLELTDFDMIAMIGDRPDDIIKIPNKKVILCAVGNADKELRHEAHYTARQYYSSGALEALTWIESNYGN